MNKLVSLEKQYFFRLYKATAEMLLARGHLVVNIIDEVDEFNRKFCSNDGLKLNREKLKIQSQRSNAVYETIFAQVPVTGKQTIQTFMTDPKIRYIVILDGNLTPSAKRFILSCKGRVQVLFESMILYQVLSHERMPDVQLLSVTERATFFNRFKLTEDSLPKIRRDDPVIQFLGISHIGDVIKFTRSSETAGQSIYFRIVV